MWGRARPSASKSMKHLPSQNNALQHEEIARVQLLWVCEDCDVLRFGKMMCSNGELETRSLEPNLSLPQF